VALIRPFSGVRFARDKFDGGDISTVIAPPFPNSRLAETARVPTRKPKKRPGVRYAPRCPAVAFGQATPCATPAIGVTR